MPVQIVPQPEPDPKKQKEPAPRVASYRGQVQEQKPTSPPSADTTKE